MDISDKELDDLIVNTFMEGFEYASIPKEKRTESINSKIDKIKKSFIKKLKSKN